MSLTLGPDEERADRLDAGVAARLPPGVAARVGPLVGGRLDDVALHTGSDADALTARHGVLALAVGRSVAMSRQAGPPTSLMGQAVLAHELAHVAQQRGAVGPSPTVVSHDGGLESEADGVAAHVVGGALGLVTGGMAAPSRRGGLALRGCAPGYELSASELSHLESGVTTVAGTTPIIESAIASSYGDSYENVRDDPDVDAAHLALTRGGYTRMARASLSLPAGRLGALLVHEMSHLRDPTNAMGLADAMEGYAYAFEMTLLRRVLAAMPPTDPERQGVQDRIDVISNLYSTPPTMPALASGYRSNYDSMTLALELLYRAIDGTAITWGASGEPPGWSPMASDKAQRTVVWLLETPSVDLRARGGGFGADLLNWVLAHELEVRRILNPPAAAPATPPPPAPSTSGSGSSAPPPAPSRSAPPFRPPRRGPRRR